MNLPKLRARVANLDQVAGWTPMLTLLERLEAPALPIWEGTRVACEACGGEADKAEGAAAAVLCLSASIALGDDILDGDPSGPVDSLGLGRAANMALALQAASGRLVEEMDLPPSRAVAAHSWLYSAALATARGQDLDTEPCEDEAAYWTVVSAKSTPLIETAMALGGICGGGDPPMVAELAKVGHLLGKIIQINDDLTDAMGVPPSMDWCRPGNNLALLFAVSGPHEDRDRFRRLVDAIARAEWPKCADELEEAQLILTRCGALGYCVYQITLLYKEASDLVADLNLRRRDIVQDYLDRHVQPVVGLLEEAGLESPLSHMRS